MKWYRLTPKDNALNVLIVQLEGSEVGEWEAYGYRVEEVVILTLAEYKRLNK